MSKETKRRYVVKELLLDDLMVPAEHQQIVRVLSVRGNNLHEVVTAVGEKFLVSMPTKFRRNVWIKRGDYVVVEAIEEGEKVKAEIIRILHKDQIRYIKDEGQWPSQFEDDDSNPKRNCETEVQRRMKSNASGQYLSDTESEQDDNDIFVNTNRPTVDTDESDNTDDERE